MTPTTRSGQRPPQPAGSEPVPAAGPQRGASGEPGAAAAGAAPAEAGLGRATLLLAGGHLAGRGLALARELAIAHFFGASGLVSALRVAISVPTLVHELFFSELASAALVPVFSAYAAGGKRAELARGAAVLLVGTALGLAAGVAGLELAASSLAWALGSGYEPGLQAAATQLIRLVLPAVWLLGMASVLGALALALQRYALAALAPVMFNLGVVAGTLLLAERYGVSSVLVGMLAGAAAQAGLLGLAVRGLARAGHVRLPAVPPWQHPVLRQSLRLFAPVAAGLVLRQAQLMLERNLASHTGPQSLAWLETAAALYRLPLGLAVAAISAASLPALARAAAAQQPAAFTRLLGLSLSRALLLTLPAAAGLWVLARPAAALLFEHGAFTPADTAQTALAVRLFVLGLPLAAMDQPLVIAFYARQNTLTPVLAGVASIGVYAIAALALLPLGMPGLALASTAQISSHALLMLFQAGRHGLLPGRALASSSARLAVAAFVAALAAWLALLPLQGIAGPTGKLAAAAGPALAGAGAYLLALVLLRSPEAGQLAGWLGQIARRAPGPQPEP